MYGPPDNKRLLDGRDFLSSRLEVDESYVESGI